MSVMDMTGRSSIGFSTNMPAIPGKKYRCPTCRNWYRPLAMKDSWSCCVMHSPGDCCHAFEEQVHKKGWHKR